MSPPESIGYPANALQGQNKLQHSTPLLCTVLSDTGHQHGVRWLSERTTWLKSQREEKTGQTPEYTLILRVEELSHKCATLFRVARGSCRGVL